MCIFILTYLIKYVIIDIERGEVIVSKTSPAVKNAWNARNYDRISVVVPKGQRAQIQQAAKDRGFKSTNEFILYLLRTANALDENT